MADLWTDEVFEAATALIAARGYLRGLAEGAIHKTIYMPRLKGLRIRLRSLEEQDRTISRTSAGTVLMAKVREALTRQKEETRKLDASAIESTLGGRVVAAGNDPIACGPDWVALTDVARLESGHTPSRKHPEWWGGDLPWISLPDIRALDGTLATLTGERTNMLGLANSSARLLPAGTVVLCRDVNVGFVTVIGVPMATSQHFVNWVPGPALRSWYLAYALISARQYLLGLSEGSLIKTIYMPKLRSFHLRLPSLEEQDRILTRINAVKVGLADVMEPLGRQASALDALGPSLLNAAFRGEF